MLFKFSFNNGYFFFSMMSVFLFLSMLLGSSMLFLCIGFVYHGKCLSWKTALLLFMVMLFTMIGSFYIPVICMERETFFFWFGSISSLLGIFFMGIMNVLASVGIFMAFPNVVAFPHRVWHFFMNAKLGFYGKPLSPLLLRVFLETGPEGSEYFGFEIYIPFLVLSFLLVDILLVFLVFYLFLKNLFSCKFISALGYFLLMGFLVLLVIFLLGMVYFLFHYLWYLEYLSYYFRPGSEMFLHYVNSEYFFFYFWDSSLAASHDFKTCFFNDWHRLIKIGSHYKGGAI